MHFTSATILSLLSLTSASSLAPRAAAVGLTPICPGLKTVDKACIRYTSGFDVTGVVTEVDLTFPLIKTACDCIQQCLDRPASCATYVYKFTSAAAVASGHRTCTLYSQFNLPSAVTIDVNLTASVNINAPEMIRLGNNPQAGSLVPEAFMDATLSKTPDPSAVSGPVWQLANGKAIC